LATICSRGVVVPLVINDSTMSMDGRLMLLEHTKLRHLWLIMSP